MDHALIIFIISLLHFSYSSLPDTDKITFTAVTSPPITLSQQSPGYFVSVNIQGGPSSTINYSGANPPDPSNNVNMMLALYSSTTLLATNCLGFSSSPSSWEESLMANGTSASYPYFTISNGSEITGQFYMSSAFYNNQLDPIMADSCSGLASSLYGSGSYGLLGMGISGLAVNNYKISPLFSIYLNGINQDGYLLFSTELSNTQSSTPVTTLATDANWHVSGVSFLKIGSVYYQVSSTNLIFDVNSNVIGLPLQIYQDVLHSLSYSQISCPPDVYLSPMCTYTGQVANLPNLVIGVGTQQIPIPPKVYAESLTANSVTLNLRALSPTLGGDNYVIPGYSNYIILGANVMSYYYSVFGANSGGGQITLYAAIQSYDLTLTVVFIVVGFIVLLIFLAFLCCCKKKKIDNNSSMEVMMGSVYPTFSDSPVNFSQNKKSKNEEAQEFSEAL